MNPFRNFSRTLSSENTLVFSYSASENTLVVCYSALRTALIITDVGVLTLNEKPSFLAPFTRAPSSKNIKNSILNRDQTKINSG